MNSLPDSSLTDDPTASMPRDKRSKTPLTSPPDFGEKKIASLERDHNIVNFDVVNNA